MKVTSLGDSVGILIKKDGGYTRLSREHTLKRADEKERILRNNSGFIVAGKIQGKITVSRAFGNAELKQVIISTPESTNYPLTQEDDLLILSTDGLFRSFTDE